MPADATAMRCMPHRNLSCEWANGRMGEWANGRMGEWAAPIHPFTQSPIRLPPVSFNPVVPAAIVGPVAARPHRVWTRRTFPATGDPYVGAAVPSVIALDPHIARTGRHYSRLVNGRGRADSNV